MENRVGTTREHGQERRESQVGLEKLRRPHYLRPTGPRPKTVVARLKPGDPHEVAPRLSPLVVDFDSRGLLPAEIGEAEGETNDTRI